MAKKKNFKKNKRAVRKIRGPGRFSLPEKTKRWIGAVLMFLVAIIIALSFFDKSGMAGIAFMRGSTFLIGKTVFLIPLLFVLGGLAFVQNIRTSKNQVWPVLLAIFVLILGITGLLDLMAEGARQGGWIGYLVTRPVLSVFDLLVSRIIFSSVIIMGGLILWHFLYQSRPSQDIKIEEKSKAKVEEKPWVFKKIFSPKFKVKEIPSSLSTQTGKESPLVSDMKAPSLELKTQAIDAPSFDNKAISKYRDYPSIPTDLLEEDTDIPAAGDIRVNSTIIKRTLQNFDIQVEMSEVNIGPTVTQYTLKPAEGVKLSRILTLNQDLSLALAAHPIRIEAPIPGRPLVGIEVPNKSRVRVRLRNLIEHQNFQKSLSPLVFSLGRDVAGNPVFADISRMPHLLVAGSTGTGKTICLNSIILSLLYRNSPAILKLILIDPKRVEFPIYNDLPHLLTPVIFDAQKTVNALKWLTEEMERRFEVLSAEKARDLSNYNERMLKQGLDPMPYIVLVIDELADLMAARGRDVEAGIVRLAQMARAVGIHLVVATQRPSVEVITGLIKANITSRVTFQVASQVDSRTILDMAGAEKLLGSGDMLFISAEVAKPRRIQGAYVSEKEVKKVINHIKKQTIKSQKTQESESKEPEVGDKSELSESLTKTLEEEEGSEVFTGQDDPLYEEAKKVVIESKKASASLLQRRLRVGYARAARLIDILEERGVVGPGDGAKPREVYIQEDDRLGM